MAEKTEKTTTKKTTTRKAPAKKEEPKRTTRKKIDKDTEVLVMNNTNGKFIYRCSKTRNFYKLSEFADTTYMTVEELKIMSNEHKHILTRYWIVPVEVLDDDIEIEDVIEYINMKSHYVDDVFLSNGEMDRFILDTTSTEFVEGFDKMSPRYKSIIAERAVILFKQDKLTDMGKTRYIEKVANTPYAFEDAEMQNELEK